MSDAPPVAPTTVGGPRWRDGFAPAVLGWCWARVAVALGWLAAEGLHGRVRTPNDDLHLSQGLVTWDGTFYREIATNWYAIDWEGARFFPLYPALARLLAPVFGDRVDLALVVLANVAALLAAWVTWHLVVEALGSASSANRAAVAVSIFPAGFVMAFAYTEGMAVLLVSLTLLALHRRMWWLAASAAFLAAALRPVGGLLLVPILVELWRARHPADADGDPVPLARGPGARAVPNRVDWALGMVGPVAGLAAAMAWIEASTGDLLLPVRAQQEIRGGFQDPVTRVVEPVVRMVTGNFDDLYNFAFVVVLLALFAVAVRRRQPVSWLAFSAVSLVVVLSAQVIDSLGRYGLAVVPLVVALAQWADRTARQVAVAVLCTAGLALLSAEAWLGRVVP